MSEASILEKINNPSQVRSLNAEQTAQLCEEIRKKLIETVSETGGHLASNLGTVELTVAIHKCFDSPRDAIIWDVGHQAYTHKLLTGRLGRFSTLRSEGGISGFTRPDESEHDLFYSGHAGVSVSQAAGVAAANAIKGSKNYAVAVIGDGSFTGGMVYEALNDAGSRKNNRIIVILNDNEMSISENVGAMARSLARVRAKPEYYRFKAGTERALNRIPVVGRSMSNHLFKLKTALKNMIYSSSFFEDMGFRYIGPIDGHDVEALCSAINSAKMVGQPVLLHVNTLKGKGYDFAELLPEKFHGVSPFNIETGESSNGDDCFSSVFGRLMCSFATRDKRICAVTAAMSIGTGLDDFAKKHADRFFDVGIAEEHALTFCSGLAAQGFLPVFAVYSSFFQRCFDQLVHDCALQRRKLVIAVDRAGFVGADGETHQGLFDVSMTAGVPGVTVYSPSTYEGLGHALYNALYKDPGVVIIRYPRGGAPKIADELKTPVGDFALTGAANPEKVIVTYGRLFAEAVEACDAVNKNGGSCAVLGLEKIKPLSPDAVKSVLGAGRVAFFEEGVRSGSVGERFALMLLENGYKGRFTLTAVNDEFVPHASVARQTEKYSLDSRSMIKVLQSGGERIE